MSRFARQSVESDCALGAIEMPISSRAVAAVAAPPAAVRPLAISPTASVTTATASARPAVDQASAARTVQLEELRERHDRECPFCTTSRNHTQTVFGEGNAFADVFFVGEAPGDTEDTTGRPFVGRAGQKLDEMIQAMGLRREDCYIANVLKSRPLDNRTPLPSEVALCGPYLVEQILIVRPKVLVSLGGPATQLLLNVETGITKLRGIWTQWTPPQGSGMAPIPVMPTFHPAYLLRNYTVQTRGEVWSDLKAVIQRIAESSSNASR